MSSPFRAMLTAAVILLFSIPAMARADKGRMDTTKWMADQETKIGNIDLKPGDYEFRSEESGNQLQVLHDGKMVGEVSCHWVQLPKKPADSEVLTDNNQITQVTFAGRAEAAQIQ